MWPDRLSNPGPLTYELGALPTALRGPAAKLCNNLKYFNEFGRIIEQGPVVQSIVSLTSSLRGQLV